MHSRPDQAYFYRWATRVAHGLTDYAPHSRRRSQRFRAAFAASRRDEISTTPPRDFIFSHTGAQAPRVATLAGIRPERDMPIFARLLTPRLKGLRANTLASAPRRNTHCRHYRVSASSSPISAMSAKRRRRRYIAHSKLALMPGPAAWPGECNRMRSLPGRASSRYIIRDIYFISRSVSHS